MSFGQELKDFVSTFSAIRKARESELNSASTRAYQASLGEYYANGGKGGLDPGAAAARQKGYDNAGGAGALPTSIPDPGGPVSTEPVGSLAEARKVYFKELENPQIAAKLAAVTHAEVGSQGPEARQAFMETILNRAAARGQTLAQTLTGNYFPDITHQRAARFAASPDIAKQYDPVIKGVLAGSNLAKYGTGNASGTVGFAGGPQTAAYGGERYGIEGPDRSWAKRVMSAQPQAAIPVPAASAAPGPLSMAGETGYEDGEYGLGAIPVG